MPNKENQLLRNPNASWTSREAYLLALVCLVSGLALGYLFRGSAVPVSNAVDAAPAFAGATPSAVMPSADGLKPLAAPLLAALKVDPRNVNTLVQLGNLYYDHQLYPEAIEYYSRALELQPKNVNVRTDLGTAYWYSGFPERAIAEYQKSLAINPNHANTWFNLGVVRLEGLKDPDGATGALEKVLATNPQGPQRQRAIELIEKARRLPK